jgi:diketogulonate reductase-like aldo/keto reductase
LEGEIDCLPSTLHQFRTERVAIKKFTICSHWFAQVQKGRVVIPKSVNKARLQQNLDVFDFELSAEDLGKLQSYSRGKEGRLVVLSW